MPDVIGMGCDLCAVGRMEKAIEKPHFLERVFTPLEREYLEAKGKGRARSAAAMFAAKEAAVKALGTGFSGGVMPEQLEVVHEASGAPGLRLSGAAAEKLAARGGSGFLLSLSHEGDMALAVAMMIR